MKLKIIIMFLVVFVVSTSLAGCRRKTSIKVPDQSIPFLTLDNANNKSVKKAYLNFWDLKNGKIVPTDKVIYSVTVNSPTDMVAPLYWDGKDCIVLPSDRFEVPKQMYKRTETIDIPKEMLKDFRVGTRIILGKDVELIKVETADEAALKYIVKIRSGDKYTKKELNLDSCFQNTHSKFHFPAAINDDGNNLNILFSGDYNSQTGMDLFLCTVDIKTWTSKLHEISVEEDTGLTQSIPPNSTNSIYFDGDFYVPGCCYSIVKVDPKNLVCSRWKKMVAFKPSEEDIAYNTSILGSFKDMIIVQFTVGRAIGTKHYICAFKNGENVGIMYLVDGNVEIMDKDGNILSSTTLNKNSSIIFPKMTGGM